MDTTKTQASIPETQTKPDPKPVQVIQLADGYMAVFSKTHIAFVDGKSPYLNDSISVEET